MIACLLVLSGCVNLNKIHEEEILGYLETKKQRVNTYRTGFDYYLPQGMQIEESNLFNEVISSNNALYYLYVDAISYQKKIEYNYKENNQSYLSKNIKINDKFGYLEINLLENAKYLIEIMYNYAKIEVIVDKEDINMTLLNAINILKSIEYKDEIIANLLKDDVLNYAEVEFNIFNTTSSDSTYITKDESYISDEEEVLDPDLIN